MNKIYFNLKAHSITNQIIYCFIIIASVGFLSLSPQAINPDTWIDNLTELLAGYNEKLPDEKVYLQIDNVLYKPGEEIWFSAYITSGSDYKSTNVSGILHVDLINPKGKPEKELQLPINNGKAFCNFTLGKDIAGGLYKVRAYTHWQKNKGDKYYFEKEIIVQKIVARNILMTLDFEKEAYGKEDTVCAKIEIKDLKNDPIKNQPIDYIVTLNGNEYLKAKAATDDEGKINLAFQLPSMLRSNNGIIIIITKYEGLSEAISRSIPILLNKISLQFFPEGGNLLSGFNNRIAFKALNEFGKPADIKGFIYDENNEKIASFDSYHQGMGACWFKPEYGKKYFAKITHPAGIDSLFALPEAMENGFMLNVSANSKNELKAIITSSKPANAFLIAQVRGKIQYSRFLELNQGGNEVLIPDHIFPAGIAQITLFNEEGAPLCERIIFVNKQKRMNIRITTDKKQYAPREKVKMNIKTTDENDQPIIANLSLAVVNDKILNYADDKQDNILSSLWLSSEVTGEIYEPSFYFKEDEPKADQALDYLLLTQGWRRFKWNDVMEKQYAISFLPEMKPILIGQVIDNKTQKGIKATIGILFEEPSVYGTEIVTDKNGYFTVFGFDQVQKIRLYARVKFNIKQDISIIINEAQSTYSTNIQNLSTVKNKTQNSALDVLNRNKIFSKEESQGDNTENSVDNSYNNDPENAVSPTMMMEEDLMGLDEVVVVGYGTQKRSLLTGSVVTVSENAGIFSTNTQVANSLMGKVAGVQVYQEPQRFDGGNMLLIRGQNSIMNSDPIYVINGSPIFESVSYSLSPFSYFALGDIKSIEILKTPKAQSGYGTSGANGTVYIQLKTPEPYYKYYGNSTKKYARCLLFSTQNLEKNCREFYLPIYKSKEQVLNRDDFRTTIYWNPNVSTNEKGNAEIEFCNSDEITTFKSIGEGFSSSGLIGRTEYNYFTDKPVSISMKLPAYVTNIDTIRNEIQIKNNTNSTIKGNLDILLPENIVLLETMDSNVVIPANSSKIIITKLLPHLSKNELNPIVIDFRSESFSDAISQNLEILPYAFPMECSKSGKAKDDTFTIDINKPIEGTLSCKFSAYTSVLSDLQSGIESIFREPYGCFEQTSASTYPNILALRFLKQTGYSNKKVENKALEFIKKGYNRLAAFETSAGGFEWYGHLPPHEGLTAYGLLEFTEMKMVYDGVSDELIERTKKWLLGRKTGNGSFNRNAGKYGFSQASENVTNAYIVYALAESGVHLNEFETEYSHALNECLESKDSYRMALLANAAFTLNDDSAGSKLMGLLKMQESEIGLNKLPIQHTLVYSYGKSAQIETAALMLLAELKSGDPSITFCERLLFFLTSNRSFGGFGNTQSTTLTLKALCEYAGKQSWLTGDFQIKFFVNDDLKETFSYNKSSFSNIIVPGLERHLSAGKNKIRILYECDGLPVPYSLDLKWNTLTPPSDENCPTRLSTQLLQSNIELGETVRMIVKLENIMSTGIPMTMAIIGIPGGLIAQPWQLKELQEKNEFAYYEVYKDYLVLYYKEMGPGEKKIINLDLKSEVKGIYTAPASCTYLYYTNEYKQWIDGEKIVID